ncbi:methionine sulfoxide reductase A [Advenella kashmirensis WT001]|uniref:Peptide methionine sulfoxide reductase MsrA n=1 Tax=Advenella kashmirensis (strain DSM 17095 / LMG 22695 / WT001) TaxID=1036672 RepID=I3UF29_ADVKW|nr:methionine sulfoxide reductase A [Advenella kashmirensis WT001]
MPNSCPALTTTVSAGHRPDGRILLKVSVLTNQTEIAVLGSGCFWCSEAVFQQLQGVQSVQSGYSGGHVQNPTYEQVCGKDTGHIEVLRIEFDPAVITYQDLLDIFFDTHDPTTPDRQGNDVGPQYASAIFWQSDEQKETAAQVIAARQADFADPIVTKLLPAAPFGRQKATTMIISFSIRTSLIAHL